MPCHVVYCTRCNKILYIIMVDIVGNFSMTMEEIEGAVATLIVIDKTCLIG